MNSRNDGAAAQIHNRFPTSKIQYRSCACYDRVEMNLSQQREHVGIGIDQHCFVSALEQMSRRVQLFMAIARVTRSNALHDLAERAIGDLNEQVDMVGHPAKGVDASAKSFNHLGNNGIELESVNDGGKQFLAMIATQHHMIKADGNMNSGESGHPCTFRLNGSNNRIDTTSAGGNP